MHLQWVAEKDVLRTETVCGLKGAYQGQGHG